MTIDGLALRIVLGCLGVIASCQLLAGCGESPTPTLGLAVPQIPNVDLARYVVEEPQPEAEQAPRHDPRVGWCEPLDQPFCRDASDCADGMRCVTPWWAEANTEAKVCAMPWPTRDERRWRANRLRVVVDHLCKRSDGCEPNDLHGYLRVIALRESTWRPWKRGRLNPDLVAAGSAWVKHRDEYAGNPAAADPERWSTGLGLYSAIPALWLRRWDVMAPPEVLCGEVEATEAHLRAARDQVRKIAGGIDCDGDGHREFTGTSREQSPSWYDVSRTNSGKLCPGSEEHQEVFAARAERVGLDPWAPVTVADLGQPIPTDVQDQVAAELRARMDLVPR